MLRPLCSTQCYKRQPFHESVFADWRGGWRLILSCFCPPRFSCVSISGTYPGELVHRLLTFSDFHCRCLWTVTECPETTGCALFLHRLHILEIRTRYCCIQTTWYLTPGTWYLVPDTWHLVPGSELFPRFDAFEVFRVWEKTNALRGRRWKFLIDTIYGRKRLKVGKVFYTTQYPPLVNSSLQKELAKLDEVSVQCTVYTHTYKHFKIIQNPIAIFCFNSKTGQFKWWHGVKWVKLCKWSEAVLCIS